MLNNLNNNKSPNLIQNSVTTPITNLLKVIITFSPGGNDWSRSNSIGGSNNSFKNDGKNIEPDWTLAVPSSRISISSTTWK